ncbi:hypothetical protein F442_12299 [Phytophthora nicotianae P10297]|uniref:Uncharacterized protein n=1 Tax=Phytophthora nicotianae P10297 TaxID=1317064 RepID=W2YZW8_PHYNI|nr:hypothetical protein F442_12299 [Phytophthora nicotianae P10297]
MLAELATRSLVASLSMVVSQSSCSLWGTWRFTSSCHETGACCSELAPPGNIELAPALPPNIWDIMGIIWDIIWLRSGMAGGAAAVLGVETAPRAQDAGTAGVEGVASSSAISMSISSAKLSSISSSERDMLSRMSSLILAAKKSKMTVNDQKLQFKIIFTI